MIPLTHLAPLLWQAQLSPPDTGGLNPIVSIFAFLVMLVILVFVHELGHLLAALRVGIRAEEFGIGYPPRMFTLFEHNGVKYTLNWLPLGGFVKFAGEGDDGVYGTGSLAEAPPWRKIPVMLAGPLMNLFLAILIFAFIFSINGYPVPTGQNIAAIFPGTPAEAAGFREGDILVSLNNASVTGPNDIIQIARANNGIPIEAVVLRDGERVALTVTPGPWTATLEDGTTQSMNAGIGFSYSPEVEIIGMNPLAATWTAVTHTFMLVGAMLNGLGQLIGGLFGVTEAPPGGVTGPIGIARATGEVIDSGGLLAFWNWTAILSINLFLLNLLPIPALDGSHIMFSLIEWVRGKKVPPEREAIIHGIGFATLMGLILLVTIGDVMNAINGVPVLGR
ncbi:MAG: site-2 protease family protein [Chloroflexaceae bacterium]|nr:site-2 protease family protein [Chloroflexaceae bacterium]